jgi:hypothetical protein
MSSQRKNEESRFEGRYEVIEEEEITDEEWEEYQRRNEIANKRFGSIKNYEED